MLNLQHAYSGCPSGRLHHLILPNDTLLIYPSGDAVLILDARRLSLTRVLAFWEAFPAYSNTSDRVSCVSVDSDMKLIVAAMGNRIASWALSGVQHDTWRVHSSLVLGPEQEVTCLHNKSGLLAIGTHCGLSVHTLILDNDLPTWDHKWTVSLPENPPIIVRFAPSLTYIAITSKSGKKVELYSTTTGRRTQIITHPRVVQDISWRHSALSSRDDLILYTITVDSTLRIFLPVLDSPQHLQLHATVDLFSSLSFSLASETCKHCGVFWLDRDVLATSLERATRGSKSPDNASNRRLGEIVEEGWDLFLRVLKDGAYIVTAIANIDRRPPTLLRHFTLKHSPGTCFSQAPNYLYMLSGPEGSLTLVTSPPLTSYEVSPVEFFGSQLSGLLPCASIEDKPETSTSGIVRFIRTPEGNGVAAVRYGGNGDVWGTSPDAKGLVHAASWTNADFVVVLSRGAQFATFPTETRTLTLYPDRSASLSLPPLISLFTIPSKSASESIIGITEDLSIVHVRFEDNNLTLVSHETLPLPDPPKKILPVDPMAWSGGHPWIDHDVLLSITDDGELAFWTSEEMLTPMNGKAVNGTSKENGHRSSWRCTGNVKTGRGDFIKARCSSAKKTALIVPTADGQELTIWDSKESEFASGLEYRTALSEKINDLDWTSTPDAQSILAVGFATHVDLLCQQRMTYFNDEGGWSVCWKVDIVNFMPYPIHDSIWLAGGRLLIGAGHQLLLYGQPLRNDIEDQDLASENLFEYVARHNGPLVDFHPQMLLQCLLWGKVDLVKKIIVNLARDVKRLDPKDWGRKEWTCVPFEEFLTSTSDIARGRRGKQASLFEARTSDDSSEEEVFSQFLVKGLIEQLENDLLPHLTPNESAHLLVLLQTTLEIEEHQRSLDANGLRYLISIRSFYILNRWVSKPSTPASKGAVPRTSARRERLRYRDMIWAFHSGSQDLLLEAAKGSCEGKMTWADTRATGISLWIQSVETLKAHLEFVARNEYLSGDARDPTACSLFYFALGKVKLVHGLWRQAAWHKEQASTLKFLGNDFTNVRWRTAALKNAYALLGKQRYEYAAAFFILGGSPKDAINVCIRNLQDFQLAIALARVVEQGNDGPILRDVLNTVVLPLAFEQGNRWLASWSFWMLRRRDYAVRVLVTPLQDLVGILSIKVAEIGEPHYDDPSLALLFSQLKSKTLQTAKGTSEISGRLEFNFVLQIARVFCRMGCHALALDLVRSWSFERPSTVTRGNGGLHGKPTLSPASSRSPFVLEPALHHRSSVMIDMDVTSLPPTRSASPERKNPNDAPQVSQIHPDTGLMSRKAGLGNLMKSARQDVQVPEFDMNAFF